jgi:LAGLIDADG-like domain
VDAIKSIRIGGLLVAATRLIVWIIALCALVCAYGGERAIFVWHSRASEMEVDRAYLAGLFDGEGCVYIGAKKGKQGQYQLVVTLTNSHKPTIDALHEQYGGIVQIHHRGLRRHYAYALRSLKAKALLQDVLPYLRIKRAEAELALEFQDHMSARHPLTPNVMSYRQGCMDRMKALKTTDRIAIVTL